MTTEEAIVGYSDKPGKPRMAGAPRNQRRQEGSLSRGSTVRRHLLVSRTARVNFTCFKPPGLWYLAWRPQETHAGIHTMKSTVGTKASYEMASVVVRGAMHDPGS